METSKSLEIIERMINENRKSLHRSSFYFLLWACLLVPAGIFEFILFGNPLAWLVWPLTGMLGGIISTVYSKREAKRSGTHTAFDRITSYTWGAFGFALIFSIDYAVSNGLSPHALILMSAGIATFISGGISKFKPFVFGGLAIEIAAIICAFIAEPIYHSLIFSAALFIGYFIPGLILRKQEHAEA